MTQEIQKKARGTSSLTLPSSDSFFITKELYDEFEKRRQKKFPGIETLNELIYDPDTKEVTGSNSFIVCYFNEILQETYKTENYRTANQADLENILKSNSLRLKGHSEDTGLVLRSEKSPNSYLAKRLMKQIKKRLGDKPELPLMIPLYSLKIGKDNNSRYKISFNLRENAELIHAPVLNEILTHFSSENIDERTGLPKKLGEGNRYFYTGISGLSRFYLDERMSLDSYFDNLAYSYHTGRVVVMKTIAKNVIISTS